ADPLGPKIVEDLESRIAEGYYGAILKELAGGKPAVPGAPGDPAMIRPGGPVPGVIGPGGQPGAIADGLPGAAPMSPGITVLGVGTAKEIVAAGQMQKIDFILVLIVAQRTLKTNTIKEIAIEVNDGSTGKELWGSTKVQVLVSSTAPAVNPVRPATTKKPADDPLDALHEKLFRFVDKDTRLGEMPAGLTKDNLGPRLTALTASPPKYPLPILIELTYYREKGLLEKDAWQAAVTKVLDEARATGLASDDLERRKQSIVTFLPSSERKIGGAR
ncbi:MAG: hypothetical protein ACRED3_20015, partial [Bradyrhizobium sp.]